MSIALALLLSAVATGRSAAQGAAQAAPPPANLPAQLRLKDSTKDVVLVGRRGTKVLYCFSDMSRNVLAIDAKEIQRLRVRFEYDTAALGKAVAAQDWVAASNLLTRVIWPALPFLDLKGNNATPLALRTGVYLMRAAMVKTAGGFTHESRRAADIDYRTAYTILSTVGKADWYDRANEGALRALICLVLLNRIDTAKAELERIAEPDASDDTYGLYWLAQAHLSSAEQQSLAAMDHVSLAVDFETHDIDTFPDALLLSAKCYEAIEDWYRARDVYYEMGMLFSKTYWGDIATRRLKYIMEQGLTDTPEEARIRNVFFGIEEDMNAKAKEFLSSATETPDAAKKAPGRDAARAKPPGQSDATSSTQAPPGAAPQEKSNPGADKTENEQK
jgi:tetratricopeptide (TPR) repeat protein